LKYRKNALVRSANMKKCGCRKKFFVKLNKTRIVSLEEKFKSCTERILCLKHRKKALLSFQILKNAAAQRNFCLKY
jgi:hypothetical protein